MATDMTGVLTFLFTDIQGSVRLWEHDEARMARLFDSHQRIVGDCIRAQGGRLVRERGEGDSTFSIFLRPGDAAAAAADLQCGLHAEDWPGDMPVRVRAALHTGTAYHGPDSAGVDFNSTTVNRCARLRGLARGGQTFLSESTYHLLHDQDLPYELRDLGFHRLRDLSRLERVYQLICPPVPPGEPPVDDGNGPPPLPAAAGRFIGRHSDEAAVRARLRHERLVTIVGLSGSGKTRLAIQVAQGLSGDPAGDAPAGGTMAGGTMAGGVWWIDADREGPSAEALLAKSLSLSPGSDPREAAKALFGSSPALIVIDGCERRREEWREVATDLLRACPAIKILATSQVPLGVPREGRLPLAPMAYPPALGLPLDRVREYDAVALFVEAAQSGAEFRLTPDNAGSVTKICAAVDGLPLGIELAAVAFPSLGLDALARRMADPLFLTQDPDGDGRSLLLALQSAYELLDLERQSALRCFSVFEDGWDLEAAEAVAAPDSDPLGALRTLAGRNLIQRSEAGDVSRYRMLRTIAGYARRRRDLAGETEPISRRHRDYYAGLVAQAARAADEDASDWLDRLERERANLAAALRAFAAAGEAETGLEMARSLYRLWSLRGMAGEGRGLITLLLAARPEPSLAAQARGLTARGALAWSQGDFRTAQTDFEQARLLRTRMNDQSGVADLDNNLGNVAWDRGAFEEAAALFRTSLLQFTETDDREGIAVTDSNLACVLLDLNDLDGAGQGFRRSLQRGDLPSVVAALDGLGEIGLRRGDLEYAWTQRCEALKMRRQIQDRAGLAESLEGLAEVDAARGVWPRAAVLLGAAERTREIWEAPLPPRRTEARRRLVAALSDHLADEYGTYWKRGYGMTTDAAARLALDPGEPELSQV